MAEVVPGWGARDLGNGTAATYYTDGSVDIWNITTGQRVGGWGPQQNQVAAGGSPGGAWGTAAPATIAGTTGTAGPTNPWGISWGQPGSLAQGSAAAQAGTTGTPYGQGWIQSAGSPGRMVNILPANLAGLSNPALAPGYIPGSGTYNQYDLSKGNLFGNIAGVMSNLNYGVGGPGDPTRGAQAEPQNQTPDQWVQGGKLFTWQGNMGTAETGTQGLDYIATLFGRGDTPSGIGTPTWGAPDQFWQGLYQAIAAGKVQPTNRGWALLATKGKTPANIGGSAIAQAESVGVQPSGAGASGTGGEGGTFTASGGAGGSDSAVQDYYATITANAQAMQAAQLAYQDWVMRTGDDKLAFEKAQQAWLETYQKATMTGMFEGAPTLNREIADWQKQYQQAGLTGTYQGNPTLEREKYQTETMQGLLTLQGNLRGPENYSQYLKVLGSTPQGMRDVVNAAAGRFTMPSTGGVTPGQQTRPADVQSLLNDVTSGGQNAQAEWTNALSGGLPNPNQFSLKNWTNMVPTQQKMLLSAYEGEGWDPNDVMGMIKQSSPVGTGGQTGTFKF